VASILTLFIYWCLVFGLLSILTVIGLSITSLVSNSFHDREGRVLGDITVIGLCYVIVATLFTANVFGAIERPKLGAFIALPVLIALVKFAVFGGWKKKEGKFTVFCGALKTSYIPLMVYSAAALVPFYTFLNQYVSKNFVLTSASKFNADLGMYLQMSSNLITHGFNDNGKVVGANVGALARFDHPGAQAALAGKSQLLGLFPHQTGIIATSCLLAIAGLCVHQILRGKHRVNDWRLYLVGLWVIVNPLVTEMSIQFFYAQLLTAVMMLGLLSLGQRFVIYHETGNFSLIFLLAVSAFVTSPEVAVMLITIFTVPLCYTYLSSRPISLSVRSKSQFMKSFAVGLTFFVIAYPFVLEEIQVLRRTAEVGIAGWSSSVLSPVGWMGLSPGSYFFSSTTLENAIGVFLVIAIVGIATRLLFSLREDTNTKLLISMFLMALVVLVFMALIYGRSEYQTWKTAISVTPVLIVGLVAVLTSWDRTKNNVSLFVCIAVGAGLASSSINWVEITQRNYVSQDIIAITQSAEYQSVSQIDVDLSPKLETMLAIPLLKGEVNLVSQSYLNQGRNSRKFTCLLTRASKAKVLGLMDDLIVQRGKYVIVGKNNCQSL
jgi:hypothetical protein